MALVLIGRYTIYAVIRMLSQLLVIGYVLVFLFRSNSPLVFSAALLVMVTVASWIALRPLGNQRPPLLGVSCGNYRWRFSRPYPCHTRSA